MTETLQQETDARLGEAYKEYVRSLRLRQSKFAYVLPVALVPAALSLDYFVYPELLGPIFRSRVLCSIAILPCWALLFTRYARRLLWLLGNAWLVSPMLAIVWMVYASEGSSSPYYAGLNLVMLAACLLTTYRAREAAVFCGFVIAAYVAACVMHRVMPPATALQKSVLVDGSLLANNLYFLTATGAVCVASCYFGSRRRFDDFRLRHEIHVNNRQLETAITKLQDTEVQLVQSEKMNALGKLSAGLLHEVNNPLNYTFMALQIAEQEAAGNAGLEETLGDIHQGMERIKAVIADLRAFAYPSRLNDVEPLRVSEVLNAGLRLTAHELGDAVVEQEGVGEVMVLGAKTQIMHVLMNLLINSAHAVKKPGLGRTPKIQVQCRPVGDRLEVSVWDNGVGVRAADLPRLLDPFFTTKEPGQGTGLGLSICHTIVENHGGKIVITSEHGSWTRVAFDLPMAPRPTEVCA